MQRFISNSVSFCFNARWRYHSLSLCSSASNKAYSRLVRLGFLQNLPLGFLVCTLAVALLTCKIERYQKKSSFWKEDVLVYFLLPPFLTSIFLPSTMVPWSSSLALSASNPLANVTKPNPFDPRSLNMISTSSKVPYFWKIQPKDFCFKKQLNRKEHII